MPSRQPCWAPQYKKHKYKAIRAKEAHSGLCLWLNKRRSEPRLNPGVFCQQFSNISVAEVTWEVCFKCRSLSTTPSNADSVILERGPETCILSGSQAAGHSGHTGPDTDMSHPCPAAREAMLDEKLETWVEFLTLLLRNDSTWASHLIALCLSFP